MLNFYSNDLEIVLTIILVPIFLIIIYDFIKRKGKFYLNIKRIKPLFIGSNKGWHEESSKQDDTTKYIEIDFVMEVYNNSTNYNSIYDINAFQKRKLKYIELEHMQLNLTNTAKSISGTTSYEKLKYINLLPFEAREFNLKLKITNEEYKMIRKSPLYIIYKNKGKRKKIKIKIKDKKNSNKHNKN